MPKVYNQSDLNIPKNAVYIGRGSPYGNPVVIGKDGTRTEVIEMYRKWVYSNPEMIKKIRSELSGKDLVCYCAPKACHGDVILEIANNANYILDEMTRLAQENGEYD